MRRRTPSRARDSRAAWCLCLPGSWLGNDVATIVGRYLTDPAHHTVVPSSSAGARMDHQFRAVTAPEQVAAAAKLAAGHRRVLLFVRTKHGAARLTRQLGQAGVRAGALHGNLPQNARQRALAAFAAGTTPVLVATDIAARGIHVDGVDLVVHFDPPTEPKAYLHRSGRTARRGSRHRGHLRPARAGSGGRGATSARRRGDGAGPVGSARHGACPA